MSLNQDQVNALLYEADPTWTDVLGRVLPKIIVDDDGCWLFTGAKISGYGVIGMGRRGAGTILTHRATYAAFVGPLVKGMHIDHLCRVVSRCAPAHLEQVTPAENKARSTNSEAVRARWQSQTACRNGHEFTAENTYYGTRNGYVTRQCRACTSTAARRARTEASV